MKQIFAYFILAMLGYTAYSQEDTKSNGDKSNQIYIESDPTTFFFNGFSIAIKRSSTFHEKLNMGVGLYKVTLPEFYIESVPENQGRDWSVDNFGLDVFVDYFIFDANKGVSIGMHLGYYNYRLERLDKQESYQSLVETLRVGYLWRPIRQLNAIYLYPWAGVSTGQKISGSNVIDGEAFKTPKWSFVPSVQIGFSF
ncbi:MAG: hypothetical protein JXQ90_22435 [Cyclobacteriaceae bacterium]